MLRFLLIATLFQCAVARAQDTTQLSWPPAPERERIRYVGTLDGRSEFTGEKGFLGGVFDALFGGERLTAWLVQPVGIAASADAILYVADPGVRGVHRIDPAERTIELWTGADDGRFIAPVGCAVDEDGNVYVADPDIPAVVVLDRDGDEVHRFSEGLVRPCGVQVSGDTVFVADAGLHRVAFFDRKGTPAGGFGTRGAGASEFNYPVQIALRESLYVLDALNYRVQSFDRTGRFGATFGSQGNVAGRFASPKGIALDSDGDIYVTDGLMDNVQIFDRDGRLLLIFGREGGSAGEFSMPSGIAITADDTIYVVDSLNRRIQIFRYVR